MKSKKITLLACLFLLCILGTLSTIAQQQKDPVIANTEFAEIGKIYHIGDYSYRLLPAQNNSFGYDIYQNTRLVFHQKALILPGKNGKFVFVGREQAQKIVLTAIEKLKQGRTAILTNEEIKKISRQ